MGDKKKRMTLSRYSNLVEIIKVEHDIPVLERIKYPIVWERLPSGYRIQDLQPSKIDNAVEIIKDHYIKEEVLCRAVGLTEDFEAVAEYLSHVASWLKDTQSLAAVEEGTGSVVGVLVGRVLDSTVRTQTRMTIETSTSKPGLTDDKLNSLKECPKLACDGIPSRTKVGAKTKESKHAADSKTTELKLEKSKSMGKLSRSSKFNDGTESRDTETKGFKFHRKFLSPMFDDIYTIVYNPRLKLIHKFKSYLTNKVDILDIFDVDIYYSIYLLLVIPQHRGKGIAKALIRCSIEISKKFNCDVVSGIFTSEISQNIVHKEGFKLLEEIRLCDWLVNDEEVFKGVEGSEHVVAVMAYKVEPSEPPPPQSQLHPPRRSIRTLQRT